LKELRRSLLTAGKGGGVVFNGLECCVTAPSSEFSDNIQLNLVPQLRAPSALALQSSDRYTADDTGAPSAQQSMQPNIKPIL